MYQPFRNYRLTAQWLRWQTGKSEQCYLHAIYEQPQVNIKFYDRVISETKIYKFLGVYLDNHLNLQHHFDKVYKKASARVKLLSRIREQIGPLVAESICKAMIRPIIIYCYQLQLGPPMGTIAKLQSIQDRTAKIVKPYETTEYLESIAEIPKRLVAIDVFKCLNGLAPEQLTQLFNLQQHGKNTRGNNSVLVLPPVRTESGRGMFAF